MKNARLMRNTGRILPIGAWGNGYSISFRLNFRNIEFASHQNVYRHLPIGMSR